MALTEVYLWGNARLRKISRLTHFEGAIAMHILRKLAKSTPINMKPNLTEERYDVPAGVWRNSEGGLSADDRDKERTTKKNDVETGEDLKGQ